VNSDPAAQLRLLDLAAADLALAQLTHRRATLPELAAIRAASARIDELNNDVIESETKRDDLAGEQRRLENEVDTVRTRAGRDEQRLTAGGLPSKELESLQHEITSLARRQSTLEDDLLEIMEQREIVETGLAELNGQRDGVLGERSALEARRDAQIGEIDAAAAAHRGERDGIATEIPDELLALYTKIAASNGGVGAAALRQRRCEGCHLEIGGGELTSFRNAEPDAVLRCENCRRILVRTSESGL
jgi:predicted  nucleic acid-binding Zn-ribbon protein